MELWMLILIKGFWCLKISSIQLLCVAIDFLVNENEVDDYPVLFFDVCIFVLDIQLLIQSDVQMPTLQKKREFC